MKRTCKSRKRIHFIYLEWRYERYSEIDGITETAKHEIKKQKGGFLGPVLASLAASLAQRVISSVVKDVTGRGVMRAGRGYNCGTLILLRLNIFHKMY